MWPFKEKTTKWKVYTYKPVGEGFFESELHITHFRPYGENGAIFFNGKSVILVTNMPYIAYPFTMSERHIGLLDRMKEEKDGEENDRTISNQTGT